jgi:hypothetical protein
MDPKRETYPWEYDHDVIASGKSIDGAEGSTGNKLTYDSAALKSKEEVWYSKTTKSTPKLQEMMIDLRRHQRRTQTNHDTVKRKLKVYIIAFVSMTMKNGIRHQQTS